MKLPYAAKTRVERKKVIEYLLSLSHPDGSGKARFFTRFGFSDQEWKVLVRALKKHGRVHHVSSVIESKYGRRYSVDGSPKRGMAGSPAYGPFGFWQSGPSLRGW